MGIPSVGDIVIVPFPFSDLSRAKRRPALILAEADVSDVILCQITSRPYTGTTTVSLGTEHFARGGLPQASYARPDKLFTMGRSLIGQSIARLIETRTSEVRASVAALFVG